MDPENRQYMHPDPLGWTEQHRVEILRALYTVMLGNPQLKQPRDAAGKTRFKLWWRLIGSAVEYAHQLYSAGNDDQVSQLDFEQLFLSQEDTGDEDSLTLADVLDAMSKEWPKGFTAGDVVEIINMESLSPPPLKWALMNFLYSKTQDAFKTEPRSVSSQLRKHLNNPVKDNDNRTLTLCSGGMITTHGAGRGSLGFYVKIKQHDAPAHGDDEMGKG